jgi:hypothetical protein
LRNWVKTGMGLVAEFGSGMGVLDVNAAALIALFETILTRYEG